MESEVEVAGLHVKDESFVGNGVVSAMSRSILGCLRLKVDLNDINFLKVKSFLSIDEAARCSY